MKLIECATCGSHEFNGNKCAYCGNEYIEIKKPDEPEQFGASETTSIVDEIHDYKRPTYMTDREIFYYPYEPPINFEDTPKGKKILKIMILILASIIWFAITIFIPPLFILTICGLIVQGCRWLIEKGERNEKI